MKLLRAIFRIILIAFAALVFILVGLLLLAGFTIFPYLRQQKMNTWQEMNYTVTASELLEDTTTKNPTYKIKIEYSYEYAGRQYSSDVYSLHENFSAEHNRKRAIIQSNPAGKRIRCFVDPADPTQATLNRAQPSDLWLGLFGLPFLSAGVFVVIHTSMPIIKKLIPSRALPLRYDGKFTLKHGETRFKKAAPVLVLGLLWNLFIAFAAWLVFQSPKLNVFSIAILAFFELFGLLLLISGLQQFARVFSPHFEVSARKQAGGKVTIEWTFSRPDLLKHLRISVERGRPSPNAYPRHSWSGTSLFEGEGDASGKGSVSFPYEEDGTSSAHVPPHTLYFHANVRMRPDVQDEFVLEG